MKLRNRILAMLLTATVLVAMCATQVLGAEEDPAIAPDSDSSTRVLDPIDTCDTLEIMLEVAYGEIGYVETPENITKYGEWLGFQAAWCATFISWCAYQAGIPASVIPYTASPLVMMNHFQNNNSLFASPSRGGTVMPQVGDIFFWKERVYDYDHVGIIVSVGNGQVTVIDGNWDNDVAYRTFSLNEVKFTYFGRPDYPYVHDNEWIVDNTHHWTKCSACLATGAREPHDIVFEDMSATKHMGTCVVCGRLIIANHDMKQVGSAMVCSVCGYTTSATNATDEETTE